MKSASQVIALDFAATLVIGDLDRLQAVFAKGGDRPSVHDIRRASAAESELRCFYKFAGKRCQGRGECTKLREGSLLADAEHVSALFAQVGGHRQKQWAGSGEDDAL